MGAHFSVGALIHREDTYKQKNVGSVFSDLVEAISKVKKVERDLIEVRARLDLVKDLDRLEERVAQTVKCRSKFTEAWLDKNFTTKDRDMSKEAPFVYYNSSKRMFVFNEQDIAPGRLNSRWYKVGSFMPGEGWVIHTAQLKDVGKSLASYYKKEIREKEDELETATANFIKTVEELPIEALADNAIEFAV
jgi:hypothetical protein